jgi:peptidoglycan/xylan/chitin deacetylase (PgdA/CDA1 family)
MYDFQIPILMYHEIATEEKRKLICNKTASTYIVDVDQFESQMRWLAEQDFSTVSLYDVVDIIENKNFLKLPNKPIVITFDDGYAGNHEFVLPILKKFELSAVFFITLKEIGTPFMMDWKQLEELHSNGMSIQSHSKTHSLLGQLDKSGITYELKESKQILQDKLQTSVNFLSLPHGSYNELYKGVAIEVGYRGGCTSEIGFVHPMSDPFFLNRIAVDSKYNIDEFKYIAEASTEFLSKIISGRKYKDLLNRILGEKFYNQLYRLVHGIKK